jgi:hypothetical protein
VGNTSLSPAASNIFVACDFGLPPRPAVPRVIQNDLGERIVDLVEKKLRFRHFSLPRTRGQRNPSAAKISASVFRLKLKKTKRLATSTISNPPGAELLAWSKN